MQTDATQACAPDELQACRGPLASRVLSPSPKRNGFARDGPRRWYRVKSRARRRRDREVAKAITREVAARRRKRSSHAAVGDACEVGDTTREQRVRAG
jgi:hypothetical protein